jgi:hypothetical protein
MLQGTSNVGSYPQASSRWSRVATPAITPPLRTCHRALLTETHFGGEYRDAAEFLADGLALTLRAKRQGIGTLHG